MAHIRIFGVRHRECTPRIVRRDYGFGLGGRVGGHLIFLFFLFVESTCFGL
jgi:hypothetical protein